MTRPELIKAIQVGQRRGNTPEDIANAIEMAIELTLSTSPGQTTAAQVPVSSVSTDSENMGPLPPSPDSVTKDTDIRPPVDSALVGTFGGKAERVPPHGIVVLASESDINKVVALNNKPSPPARLRSFTGVARAPKMRLEDAVAFWTSNAPEKIEVIPEGRDEPITLERTVSALPGFKNEQGKKPEDFVKVAYKHPAVEDSMEVSYPVAVSFMHAWINVDEVIEKIKIQARQMYRPRPRTIRPTAPPPNDFSYRLDNNGRPVDARGEVADSPQEQDRMRAMYNQYGDSASAHWKEEVLGMK